MVSPQQAETTIVIRDRRKPNQYTTDNVIAREWLPILRIGDAFFFYSIFLSMANRETESSWSSLRTLSQYLHCGVDLILRANKLLEICELIYIETGNHRTSNEYYILDPPSLTPELKNRIYQRLDDIGAQESSKNWLAWAKQVRKALDRHRSLPGIWADRRAKRGGRPVKTIRPDEGVRDSQPLLPGKGGCESQPGGLWPTHSEHVTHTQGGREPQSEQEQLTDKSQQERAKEGRLLSTVQDCCHSLGISSPILDAMLETYPVDDVMRQLEWLPFRKARDPAAMLISAVQGRWSQPAEYDPVHGRETWESWLSPDVGTERSVPGHGEPANHEQGEPSEIVLPGTERDAREVWALVLGELRLQMTKATFDTWLGGSEVVGASEQGLEVHVRDTYAVEWLRARWLKPIQRTLAGIVGRRVEVRFVGGEG